METIEQVWAWLGHNEWACFASVGICIVLVGLVERAL